MYPLINSMIIWTRKLEFEEEMRKSHRPLEMVNNLAPVQSIRANTTPVRKSRPEPKEKEHNRYCPELERCEVTG